MSNESIKLSSGVSCFVCDTFISFGLKEGCVIIPTVAFCSMSFNEAKKWLQLVRIDINRDDFRSIYIDGGLSLAGLLDSDLPKWGKNDSGLFFALLIRCCSGVVRRGHALFLYHLTDWDRFA